MRIVFVNGSYQPDNEASISIFDRGFLFADAVYEVTAVLDGKLVDFAGHIARLKRSLGELGMRQPATNADLLSIHRKLIDLNGVNEGLVYLQVSRGADADRDFMYSDTAAQPTLVAFTQKRPLVETAASKRGLAVITADDLRWQRGDIKTVQLLYASMVKNLAKSKGADDVWLVRDDFVTEGASNNAFIVTMGGTLVTRNLSNQILGGITRDAVFKCATELDLRVEERPFTVEEATAAAEAFSTSASGFVAPVVKIDAAVVGDGQPGRVTLELRKTYIEMCRRHAV